MNSASTTKPQKVLICDDDRTHLLILTQTLTARGFEVKEAANGKMAYSVYEEFLPDIILLDVNMPEQSGYEVCSRIRATKHGKNVPILMVTGSDDNYSIEKAFNVGATDFLPKPMKWALVEHRIKYMLRSYEYQKSLRKREEELNYLAYYDGLTDLPNRQLFTQELTRAIALSKRQQSTIAIMFIDLDNFKRVNDTLGHGYGDIVLKEVANRLSHHLRTSDVVTRMIETNGNPQLARLGGNEFTIILSDCGSSDEILKIAKRILESISKPIEVERYSLVVTASIGIAICPNDGETPEELIKYADMAMHEAKDNGKSCIKFHSKELHERSLNRLKLEEHMRLALKSELFELYFQAQTDSSTGKVKGAEALLRLNHQSLGVISPIEFIPVAEDTGLIVDIGYWVIEQACEQLTKWNNTPYADISISVNVSIKQINQPDFIDKLRAILTRANVSPTRLEIELTESIVMNNPQESISKLNAIKQLGVNLSIDDFGTGYSSLSYLKKFPLDTLKIDRSFVINLTTDTTSDDAAIVNTIAAMAKALRFDLVVEGVETKEQLSCVNDLCSDVNTLIQGYYYAKPMAIDDFVKYLDKIAMQ